MSHPYIHLYCWIYHEHRRNFFVHKLFKRCWVGAFLGGFCSVLKMTCYTLVCLNYSNVWIDLSVHLPAISIISRNVYLITRISINTFASYFWTYDCIASFDLPIICSTVCLFARLFIHLYSCQFIWLYFWWSSVPCLQLHLTTRLSVYLLD